MEKPTAVAGKGEHAPVHLYAALIVLALGAAALVAFNVYADGLAARYVRAVAPIEEERARASLTWEKAAFETRDLLPLYGSSELDHASYEGGYHASELLKAYPTGFTVYPVGGAGNTCITITQQLLALGSKLRGKKVAISLSPPWFIRPGAVEIRRDQYAGNFSRLHAYAVLLDPGLDLEFRRELATRMLEYRATLRDDDLLRFVVRQLADGGPGALAGYALAWPLAQLQTFVLEQQDKFEAVQLVAAHPEWSPDVERATEGLDWDALIARATREGEDQQNNNPYGFYNEFWTTRGERTMAESNRRTDAEFLETMRGSPDWADCELLLKGLTAMGAETLVLSQPIKGAYYRDIGVTYAARREFYLKEQELARTFGVRLAAFADHDDDLLFVVDPFSHLGPRGWAFYTQALDAFYHESAR